MFNKSKKPLIKIEELIEESKIVAADVIRRYNGDDEDLKYLLEVNLNQFIKKDKNEQV
jgi:hypothetical protein